MRSVQIGGWLLDWCGIREEQLVARKLDRVFTVEIKDTAGTVHASIEKTVHVSRRES